MKSAPSTPNNREVECKFAVESVTTLHQLAEQPGLAGLQLIDGGTIYNTDSYYDSPDFLLLHHGFSLRVRATSRKTLVTLKTLPDPGETILNRLEIETPIRLLPQSTHPDWLPPDIVECLAEHALAPASLHPYLQLQQTRIKRYGIHPPTTASTTASTIVPATIVPDLPLNDLDPHIEVSLDTVEVLAPSRANQTGTSLGRFFEIEVEALTALGNAKLATLTGDPALAGLQPLQSSKLQRALQIWAGASRTDSAPYPGPPV